MHARPRRAAGPGQLSGLQPPRHRTGRPQSGPAKTAPRPRALKDRRVQSRLLRDLTRPHCALCPSAGADSEAWACSPGVGESHRLRLCTLVGERWRRRRRRADSGAGLTPAPESPGCGPGEGGDFPGPQGNRGGGAPLPGVAVSSLPKLVLNWNSLSSGCARIYAGSCVTGEETGWAESRCS